MKTLKEKINVTLADAEQKAKDLIKDEALRVAKCWEPILIEAAESGKTERRFTEMTRQLAEKFENATDLTTRCYLGCIAEYYRSEGLTVSGPHKITNVNGFQMEIRVTLT